MGHVLPRVPDPAEHLDRALGHGAERVTGPEGGEGDERGAVGRAGLDGHRGTPDERPAHLDGRALVDEAVLDGLEGADRAPERDPFARA